MCSCVKKPYAVLKFWPTRYTDTTCSRNDDSVGEFYSSRNMLNFISNTLPSFTPARDWAGRDVHGHWQGTLERYSAVSAVGFVWFGHKMDI